MGTLGPVMAVRARLIKAVFFLSEESWFLEVLYTPGRVVRDVEQKVGTKDLVLLPKLGD